MGAAKPEPVAIWTFRDDAGLHHLAVPVANVTVDGKTYALAVSDRPGLLVLEEKGGKKLAPVADAAVVARVREAFQTTVGGAATPALLFEAKGPGGRKRTFAAVRGVAHAGEAYIHALDPATGEAHIFNAGSGAKGPVLVTDDALARRVREIAERATRAPTRAVTLTLPTGERRDLEIVDRVEVGGTAYAIALDRADPARAHVLTLGSDGSVAPVSDPATIERIRAALRGPAAGPPTA